MAVATSRRKGIKENGQPDARKPADDEPFSALAFKILTDPRSSASSAEPSAYSGVLDSSNTLYTSLGGARSA